MEKTQSLIEGLGGSDNIVDVEPCITRIRVVVNDSGKVSEADLRAAGAFGVVIQGNNVVQVVLGPDAEAIAERMK